MRPDPPTYAYFECRLCEWSAVLQIDEPTIHCCRLCAEDNGKWVPMTPQRLALASDKPEFDERPSPTDPTHP